MTDDELDPTQERVRRLIAEARHDGPVPPEVGARLDAALERLVDERRELAAREGARDGVRDEGRVADLDARRRRRRWTVGLAAAAAAVVAGVSLPTLTGVSLNAGSDAGSTAAQDAAAESAGSAGEGEGGAADDSAGGAGGADDGAQREFSASGEASAPESTPESSQADSAAPLAAAATVDPQAFKRDAVAARDQAGGDPALTARPTVCGAVPSAAEQVVLVQYDAQAGYLVFEPTDRSDRQLVTLYLCPGGVPARQAVVPGP